MHVSIGASSNAPLNRERNAGRVYWMLETVTDWFDANVSEVRMDRDQQGILQATVRVEEPSHGSLMMLVSTTEDIIIVWRNECPIRIDDATLAHIRRSLQPTSTFDHFATEPPPTGAPDDLNPTIVDFIQSLDMDWPDGPEGV